MVDNSDKVVCSILLDKKYDFVVVFSKSRTIGELRAEIDKVAREVYPEFGGGQVSRVENQRGSVLPDRYQVGILLENGSRVICYSSGGKQRENVKKLRSQKVQTSETVRNKPSVTNNTSKHSLLEAKRTASDNVCGSSEDKLPGTKYKSLFTIPELCCPKRKEAIKVSACKVAEWLSVHDLSSNVDAQDSESDEGTMEVGSEYEGRPERVVGKRVRSNRKGKSDDDEHDNDVDDIDYDGDGSHSENTDSDNGDVSILESLSDRNQATRKTTTCYTPKGVRANRNACASVSTSKPKRKAIDCARKKNEALSTASHGTQSNLPPSKSDRENRSRNNSALPSLAGNLPKCQIEIKRLPICVKHGRNWKVVHLKTRHETNKRRQRGDVMSNRGSEDKGKNKESTPMYLTPIKGGEQIAWLKQSGREDASEQTADEYEDFMKRLEMSDCSITSDESKRSKTENRPPLSSVGQKQTLKGNVQLKFTSQSPIKKRFEQKQLNLQEKEDTLEENVNEEIVGDRRMISEKTTEGNVELEFTPQSPIENRSVQKQRETLENNNEECVSDGRVISEDTTEGNVELEFTSQSPIKKRSEQKQRELLEREDTLEDNVNEESVVERRIISEQILEGNRRFESISQSPTKKRRSDRKRGKVEDKDTLEENRNEGSVDERRIMTQKTLEGNGRFQFTSPSPIKKRSEQTQRKLQESEDTLEENVNVESVDERRIITEKILEGNVRFESTSRSPTKKKRSDRKRGIVEDEVTLEENVHEESVDDRRMISEKTTEGNVELKFTSQSPIKNRSVQKQRETLENNNEESVSDGRVISENTTEGNVELEFSSQSPIKKRSEAKQRNLQESKDTREEIVNEERVDERRILSEKSLEGNERFEFTSPSPIKKRSEQKQRKLQGSEDTLEKNVNVESVDESRTTSEKILEGNGRFEFTSQSPTKKRRSDRKRRIVEDLDTLEENVHEGSVDGRRMISEKTTEGNVELKFTSQSPIKNRSVQKQRETLENNNEESVSDGRVISEDTTEGNAELEFTSQSPIKNRSVQKQRETLENNNEKSVSDGRVFSEDTTEGNAELELISQSPIKKRSEQKQRNLQENEDTLEKNLNEERVDESRIFSEKSLEENGRFEFTSPSPNKRRSEQKERNLQGSKDTLGENVNEERVDERRIISEKTVEENGRFEFTSPSPNKRRSEQKQRNLQGSEDTLGENVNEESVDERRIMSEKTVEENGRFEFTSPRSFKKRSEQKQQNLPENEGTLEENVNEESVDEKRIISEKILEENGRFNKSTSRRARKKRSDRKRRIVEDEVTLEENVHEESVNDRGMISKKTTEGNVELKFTSQSPIKNRSVQKQRETLENNNEEIVSDGRVISENTTKGNAELEFTSPSPIKKRSEPKQRNLQENEDTLEENVNEERVDKRITSEKTLKRNERFEFTSSPIKKRSEQKQRNLQESEDTLEGNLNQESVDERGIMSEKTLEESGRFEFTSPSPIKKRSEQKQRKLQEREDTLGKNVNEERVDERRIISENILEGNRRFKFTSPSPNKKRSKQKQRKLQESEDTLEQNVNEESVDERRLSSEKILEGNRRFKVTSPSRNKKRSKQKQRKLQESEDTQEENLNQGSLSETTITSKKRLQNNVEVEYATKDHVDNNNNIKIAVKRKAAKRKWGVLRKSDSQASVVMETPKKLAREDGYCEENKKTYDRKTQEGANNISDGRQEGNHIEMLKKNKKKKREKRKEKSELCGTESTPQSTPTSSFLEEGESSQNKDQQAGERVEREFASNVKNKHQISNVKAKKGSDCDLVRKQESLVFNAFGQINFKKKDRYCEEKRGEDNEKSNDRKRSNQGEKVNNRDDQLQKEVNAQHSKKKMKKKEKRKKHVLNSMESASELPSSLNLETVTSDSLDDSGYGENGHNKSKQHEQCVPERVESVHQPLISKKRKAAGNHEETPSGQGLQSSKPDADSSSDKTNSKKKSKTSLSLLDLALDAEQGSSNKATNRKTVLSEGRPAHHMARHFRQTPKGFLHPAKKRRITASSTAVVTRRKPRINRKVNVEMTAKERDLIASGISLEQLLDDESLWNT